MKKKVLILLVIFSIAMGGCTKGNTKKVLSNDVSKDIKEEISEAKQLLIKGKKSLAEDDYVNAKVYYDKAIELDKSNKDMYIEIKNDYLDKGRYGDAYYTVKKAIDNKIDETNMTNILNDIKAHFNTIELTDQVDINGFYSLPTNTEVDVDGQNIIMNINWNSQIADTSAVGEYKYEGDNEQYGRKFVLNLSVVKKEQIDSSKDNNKDNINDGNKEVSEPSKRECRDVAGDNEKQMPKEEVKNLIINGVNTFADIVGPNNVNEQNTLIPSEESGRTYAECTKYTSTEAIVDALRPYYTAECINRFIDGYVFVKDGKTFVTLGNIGELVNSNYDFNILYGEDLIEVNAKYDYSGWVVHRDYVLANTESGWKMNKISEIGM